jgi:hypothetical protein
MTWARSTWGSLKTLRHLVRQLNELLLAMAEKRS